MKPKQDTMLAVRVPADLAETIRRLASLDERSLSSFIKLALRHEIQRAEKGQGHRDPVAA